MMADESYKDYQQELRGNQEVFVVEIMRSPEFKAIKQKHLSGVFLGIYELLKRVEGNDESAQKVRACVTEITSVFRVSEDTALRMLLIPGQPESYSTRYLPHVRREGSEVVLRLNQKTTKKDIDTIWKLVKELQREIGGSGGKQSINPELAFCIHRQYILEGRKMKDIFDDYRRGKLEGYEHPATIEYEDEFRKYYKRVVKGL